MSGLSNKRFLFYGFLSNKKSQLKKELINLKDEKNTIIFYESPFRIKDTLTTMLEIFGNRKAAIVREISKIYEEVNRNNINNLIDYCDKIKGEIVIVVEGNNNNSTEEVDINEKIKELLDKGYSKRDAISEVADRYNINKNKIYNNYKE